MAELLRKISSGMWQTVDWLAKWSFCHLPLQRPGKWNTCAVSLQLGWACFTQFWPMRTFWESLQVYWYWLLIFLFWIWTWYLRLQQSSWNWVKGQGALRDPSPNSIEQLILYQQSVNSENRLQLFLSVTFSCVFCYLQLKSPPLYTIDYFLSCLYITQSGG